MPTENGNQSAIDTYSEAWRAECEAREVLSWKLKDRRKYLVKVEEHRGLVGRQKLEEELIKQWNLRTKQSNTSSQTQASMQKPKQTEFILSSS